MLSDKDDRSSLISRLTPDEAKEMLASGRADRGMIPKLEACLAALEGGVKHVHLLNGSTPNALLIEVFTDLGVGTMIAP